MSDLLTLVGPCALEDYERAKEQEKPALLVWFEALPLLSDEEFFLVTRSALHDSLLAQRFQGNWYAQYAKSSAAHWESCRRLTDAGHERKCPGPDNVYNRAYNALLIEHGHTPRPSETCTCFEES
jgi:hypothetical protein